MSTNERDTHFQGFAKLVWQKLLDKNHGYIDIRGNFGEEEEVAAYELLLAQAAYDLGRHIFYYAPITEYEYGIDDVPDLTAWPKPD